MGMSDFETRLADVLARQAERAPEAAGLVEGARRRLRRRRIATAAAAMTAVVAVTLGLPFAVGAMRSDPPADEPTTTDAPPPGWRLETWHNLRYAVPTSWTYGSVRAWCVNAVRDAHYVEQPGAPEFSIGCGTLGYGVLFSAVGDPPHPVGPPTGATVRTRTIDGITLTAITKDPRDADLIVASLRKIYGLDANGCELGTAVPASGTFQAHQDADVRGPVSICHYAAGYGHLTLSEALSGDDSERVLQALRSAPPVSVTDRDCPGPDGSAAIMVRTADRVIAWVYYRGCQGVHVDLGDGGERQVTEEVLYMVLSPGWVGPMSPNLPLPPVLRGP